MSLSGVFSCVISAKAEGDAWAGVWIQEVRESVSEARERKKCGIKQSQRSYYIQERTKSGSDLMLYCQVSEMSSLKMPAYHGVYSQLWGTGEPIYIWGLKGIYWDTRLRRRNSNNLICFHLFCPFSRMPVNCCSR